MPNPVIIRRLTGRDPLKKDLCVVDIADGGGDSFECYGEREISGSEVLNRGSGFKALWKVADAFGSGVDSFESYDTGSAGEVEGGSGFDGAWILGNQTDNNIEPLAWRFSGYVIDTSVTVFSPVIGSSPGKLHILALMRRSAIVSGLDGWTLVASQKTSAEGSAIDQWTEIYVRDDFVGASVTITQATSGRLAAALLLVAAADNQPITVESQASAEYSATSTSPGLHPIQTLVSEGDGRIAVHASSCTLASTGGVSTAYTIASPWTQITPASTPENRFCVGWLPMQAGESTTDDANSAEHAVLNHNGGEITLIFRT
jgi:hypothetical protein